jgi:hypothetical protein
VRFFVNFFGFDFDEVHSDYIRWVAVAGWQWVFGSVG